MNYIPRAIENVLQECLSDTPVAVITGPRQSGKTTLARHLLNHWKLRGSEAGSYLTLDDENILSIARHDPIGLLRSQSMPVIIDEVQRVPELVRTVKLLVDEERKPGSFILTGSANLMTAPSLADSLAGRAEFITLLPFSQAELAWPHQDNQDINQATNHDMASRLFLPEFWTELPQQQAHWDIVEPLLQGGYPEVVNRTPERRARWYRAYVDAIIQRDIKEVFQLQKLDELSQLLGLLAGLSAETLNYASLGKAIQMDSKSVQKYICALENMYLVRRIPAWHRNELRRVIKQPKIHFIDTGLLCALRGIRQVAVTSNPEVMGKLMETWVGSELLKSIAASEVDSQLFHYRDKDKKEVDFIVTGAGHQATGIEVKAGMTIKKSMFATLEMLMAVGHIQQGIIVYNGDRVLPFSDRLAAIPAAALFRGL